MTLSCVCDLNKNKIEVWWYDRSYFKVSIPTSCAQCTSISWQTQTADPSIMRVLQRTQILNYLRWGKHITIAHNTIISHASKLTQLINLTWNVHKMLNLGKCEIKFQKFWDILYNNKGRYSSSNYKFCTLSGKPKYLKNFVILSYRCAMFSLIVHSIKLYKKKIKEMGD